MKVLVVLSAIVASCLVSPSFGQVNSGIRPVSVEDWKDPQDSSQYPSIKTRHTTQESTSDVEPDNYRPATTNSENPPTFEIPVYSETTRLERRKRQLYSQNIGGWGIPAILANGHIADTPEVAAAKAAHYAEHARQGSGRYKRQVFSQNIYGWGIPAVLPNGHIADTPEVAAAKAAHFAEYAREASRNSIYKRAAVLEDTQAVFGRRKRDVISQNTPEMSSTNSNEQTGQTNMNQPAEMEQSDMKSNGERQKRQIFSQNINGWGIPAVLPNGHIADTPEVAAAKAAHFAEYARQASGHYMYKRSAEPAILGGRQKRQLFSQNIGGWGIPAVRADGYLADTPEVAAAKAAHFAEYARQASGHAIYKRSAEPAMLGRRKRQLFSQNINGWGIPAVLPNGHIADTPEVAAAKAAHFAEYARQAGGHYIYKRSAEPAMLGGRRKRQLFSQNIGGWGIPAVRADGYLADTPEVAAAKAAHFAEYARQASGHASQFGYNM